MLRTSNPVLSDQTFGHAEPWGSQEKLMTVGGAVNKSLILLGLVLSTAVITWRLFYQSDPTQSGTLVTGLMIGGLIGGLVFGLATVFARKWAAITAPLYALCEGFFLGGLSAMMELRFPGIVIPAVGLTFGVALSMFLLYQLGVLKATPAFTRGVVAATCAIGLVYLVSLVLNLFSIQVPLIHGAGPVGIAFSAFVVVIAALNLVLDFDLIERGAAEGMPRHMEWYAAFALMVTLIWLYLEILRLLSKLRER